MGLLGQKQPFIATKFNGVHLGQALLGAPLPLLFGQRRLSHRLIWYGDFTSAKAQQPGGSGLGKGGTEYVYTASIVAALFQSPAGSLPHNLLSVWDSTGKFVVQNTSETYTITGGSPSYTVTQAALFTQDQGSAYGATYSVTADDYGSPGSVTLSGTQQVLMLRVASSPASGQYSVNPSTGVYTFAAADAGKEVTITYTYYRYNSVVDQNTIVPFVGPYVVTVDNQPYWNQDEGVTYYPSGIALTAVGGTPSIGQYNPNRGNYTFAAGDAGQGVTISYSYKNPNVDNNAPNTLNMTFFDGAQGQAPWSYLTSKHPGQALGYTQVAYVASSGLYLGYSPEVPAYSYEILGPYSFGGGIVDACPSDCIQAVLSDAIVGIGFPLAYIDGSLQGITREFSVANNFFISPYLDTQRSAASVIGDWNEAGQVGCFWSEGLFKFIPFGTATAVANGAQYNPPTQPLYSFTDSDYLTDGAQAPIKVGRSAWQDAYNKVEVQWSVRSNDYNTDVCPEQDDAAIQTFGLRLEPPKSYDFICTLPAAQFAANMRVQRNVHIRNTYTFRVRSNFAWLDPMDVIEVNDSILGLVSTAARIIKMTDDPQKGITIVAEDFPWATGNPSLYPKQTTIPSSILSLGQQAPGDTNLLVIEVPSRANLYAGDILYLFANGNTPNWGGCTVWKALGIHSCAPITNVAASGGTLTVVGTNTGPNALVATEIVTFFNTGTVLDQITVTVATASGTGFTATYTGTIASTPVSNPAASAWSMTAFQILGQVSSPARLGILTGNLASYSSSNPDTTDTLAVEMNQPDATLSSVSAAAAAQNYPVTLSAVISAGPAVEFLSYETATLTSAGTPPAGPEYNLTTLYRGLLGTAGSAHSAGDIFVRLDEASLTYQYDPSLVSSTIFLTATSVNAYGNQQQELPQAIYPINLAGSGPGSVNLDTGQLNTASYGYTTYRPLSNPLTAIDAGSSATVDIAAFTMQIAGYGAIGYNSGAISGLSYNTLYYIYFDQAPATGALEPAGGTVTYVATTTKETAMTGTNRAFIGSITTPRAGAPSTTGNNDGGNGAQSGMQNIYYFGSANNIPVTVAGTTLPMGATGTGALTNLGSANDGDPTTACIIDPGASGLTNLVVAYPPALTRRYATATLYLAYSVDSPSYGSGYITNIFYTYQGAYEVSLVHLDNTTVLPVPYTVASVALPQGINLSTVSIWVANNQGFKINFFEAWLEVDE